MTALEPKILQGFTSFTSSNTETKSFKYYLSKLLLKFDYLNAMSDWLNSTDNQLKPYFTKCLVV